MPKSTRKAGKAKGQDKERGKPQSQCTEVTLAAVANVNSNHSNEMVSTRQWNKELTGVSKLEKGQIQGEG